MGTLTFGFLIVALVFLLGKAQHTCFSSSASQAKSITTVYDDANDNGEFWYRHNAPLVPCNVSVMYSSKSCVCCNDSVTPQIVLVVLANLTSSVKLVFEGPGGHISFNQTDCPRPEPVGITKPGPNEPNGERGRIGLILLACLAFLLFLLFVVVILRAAYRAQHS